VRNGSVVDLKIEPGVVTAAVSGSDMYRTTVRVTRMAPARWRAVVDEHGAQVSSLVDLLQGRLPRVAAPRARRPIERAVPRPRELVFSCSCPDWASMCKHVAAVL